MIWCGSAMVISFFGFYCLIWPCSLPATHLILLKIISFWQPWRRATHCASWSGDALEQTCGCLCAVRDPFLVRSWFLTKPWPEQLPYPFWANLEQFAVLLPQVHRKTTENGSTSKCLPSGFPDPGLTVQGSWDLNCGNMRKPYSLMLTHS